MLYIKTTDGQRIQIREGGEPTGPDNKCWQGPFFGTHEGRERAAQWVRENAHLHTYSEVKKAWRKIAKSAN